MKEWVNLHAWLNCVIALAAITGACLICYQFRSLPAIYLAGVWMVACFFGVLNAFCNHGTSRPVLSLSWSLLLVYSLPLLLLQAEYSVMDAILAGAAVAALVSLFGPSLCGITMLAGTVQSIAFYWYILGEQLSLDDLDWQLAMSNALLLVIAALVCRALFCWLIRSRGGQPRGHEPAAVTAIDSSDEGSVPPEVTA